VLRSLALHLSATIATSVRFDNRILLKSSLAGAFCSLALLFEFAGEWKIRVQHFSRYGLLDSDSENDEEGGDEENTPGPASQGAQFPYAKNQVQKMPTKAPQEQSFPATKTKALQSSRIRFDEDVSESMDYEDEETEDNGQADDDVNMSEAAIIRKIQADASKAYVEVYDSIRRQQEFSENMSTPTVPSKGKAFVSFEEDGEDEEDFLVAESCAPTAVMIDENEAARLPSITMKLLKKAQVPKSKSVDFGLRMRRSFRVGFLPDGSFLKLEGIGCSRLVQCRPRFSDDVTMEVPHRLLQVQQKHAQTLKQKSCPIYALPSAVQAVDPSPNTTNEFVQSAIGELSSHCTGNEEAQAAFALLSSLLCVRDAQGASLSNTRCVAAVTQLLQQVCSKDVSHDIDVAKRQNKVPEAIFAALSGGDVEKACSLATEAGLYGLASLLSAGAVGKKDTCKEIQILTESGDMSKLSRAVLRNLKAISGDSGFEDDLFRDGLVSLDWRRRLTLRLLQHQDIDLPLIMQRYESDVSKSKVPIPYPRYERQDADADVRSGLYMALRSSADPKSVLVSEVVAPRGFTPFDHDYSFSFHLASALSAVKSSLPMSEWSCEYTSYSYELQLVNSGYWEWAVFVALCSLRGDLSGDVVSAKSARAKEMVLRYFSDTDPLAQSRRSFLENRVGIPSAWFDEALAGRYASRGQVLESAIRIACYDKRAAVVVLESLFLPNVVFLEKEEMVRGMKLLGEEFDVARSSPDSLIAAVYHLFVVGEEIASCRTPPDHDALADWISKLNYVEGLLHHFYAQPSSPSLLLPVPYATQVPMHDMVVYSLDRVRTLKMKLHSLSSGRANLEVGR